MLDISNQLFIESVYFKRLLCSSFPVLQNIHIHCSVKIFPSWQCDSEHWTHITTYIYIHFHLFIKAHYEFRWALWYDNENENEIYQHKIDRKYYINFWYQYIAQHVQSKYLCYVWNLFIWNISRVFVCLSFLSLVFMCEESV